MDNLQEVYNSFSDEKLIQKILKDVMVVSIGLEWDLVTKE